jgi:hypothetical protein
VYDRGPSLCHGRVGNRAFCDGERLRIWWGVLVGCFGVYQDEVVRGKTYEKRKKTKRMPMMIRPRTSQRAQLFQVLRPPFVHLYRLKVS